MSPTLLIGLGFVLVAGLTFYFIFKRNPFNKHKYVRLVKFHDDMVETVQYIKRDQFNQDHEIMINPKNVFSFKGYKTIVITSNSQESINPLDFKSAYNAQDFKTAMHSKLIKDAFDSTRPKKFDPLTILMLLSGIELLAILYLLYIIMGQTS